METKEGGDRRTAFCTGQLGISNSFLHVKGKEGDDCDIARCFCVCWEGQRKVTVVLVLGLKKDYSSLFMGIMCHAFCRVFKNILLIS